MIVAATLAAVVAAILVVANWGTRVRDHVEAWQFQLTRDTRIVYPEGLDPDGYRTQDLLFHIATEYRMHHLANALGCPLIFDSWELTPPPSSSHDRSLVALLETNGWRVIDQRFPRRAYVVIRVEQSFEGAVRFGRAPDPGICYEKAR